MKSILFTFPVFLFAFPSAFAGLTSEEIAKREAAEQLIPVRPGDLAKGIPFWTAKAQVARRPISFDFKPVDGAVRYEYLVIAADHARYTFTTNSPSAPLTPVWTKLPAGPVTVFVEGLDKDGKACGRAGFKRFAKSANYTGDYPKAKRPYEVAARKVYEYLISIPAVTAIADTGKPDPNYGLNSYPTKMRAGTIHAMLAYARLAPEKRDRAFAIACAEGDELDRLKARTLADSIVNMQDDDGRIPTWWERETFRNREADWLNCMAAAAAALQEVAEVSR